VPLAGFLHGDEQLSGVIHPPRAGTRMKYGRLVSNGCPPLQPLPASSNRCCCSARTNYRRARTGSTSCFDGFRAIAFKSGGKVHLRSGNDKDFNSKDAAVVKALSALPDETVIDGEIVALMRTARDRKNKKSWSR
jgi:hypothetical protein